MTTIQEPAGGAAKPPLPLGQIRRERIWIDPKGGGQDSTPSEGRGEGIKNPPPAGSRAPFGTGNALEPLPHSAAPIVDAAHPWLGLNAYSEATQAYFFGRDAEIRELYSRVRENPLTILYGQSGLGKSSLLGAGLLPKFKIEQFRPLLLRLDFSAAAPPLLAQTRAALYSAGLSALPEDQGEPERDPPSLWEILHHSASLPADLDQHPPVLIFDQFEEIFTLGAARAAEVDAWFQQIADWVENRPPADLQARFRHDRQLAGRFDSAASPARLLLTLREDYLSQLERWKNRLPSLMRNRMALHRLNGEQALEAVLKPGALGAQPLVTEPVGAQIVRKIAQQPVDTPLSDIEAVPPFLSLLCEQLNAARLQADPPQAQIDAALVDACGDDILDQYYRDSFRDQPAALRCLVEERLVSGAGHRHPVPREDAEQELRGAGVAQPGAALDALINRRLLSVEARHGIPWLELTHDILAPLALRSRGARREQEARQQAARQRRRQRYVVTGLTALVLLFAGLAAFGWYAYRQAEQQKAQAELARAEAENLVSFMIFDLRDKLAPLGRLSLMDAVNARVEVYYQRMGQAGSAVERRRRAAHFFNQGNALLNQGDVAAALQRYQAGLAIMRDLVAQDPHNTGWQRDLSVGLEKVGNVQLAQGELTAALSSYRESLDIRRKLAAQDPNNAGWQRDLSVSLENVGNVQRAQGDLAAALLSYRESLDIIRELAAQDPQNADWQRDLSVSLNKVGAVQRAQGELGAALLSYRESLEIIRKLAAQDPYHAGWQQDLMISNDRMAGLLLKQGDVKQAREYLNQALNLAEALVKISPTPNTWISLSWYHLQLGQFPPAKLAAEKGLKLTSEVLELQGNLAHAHLFLGEAAQAAAIYRQYQDRRVADGRTWKRAIADDFEQFRRLGMEHPQMQAIEALLGLDKTKAVGSRVPRKK